MDYYCPCCKGLIKPRAYKKENSYQVQPHFYHISGGCKEETFVHFICKNWLFNSGCKFIVNGITYEVDSIETEKTLHTSFGDYRPDIIVHTSSSKIFYFEIKVTNRKTDLYAPKWDELGNDVVEVDTRYFINQKYKNNIPVFDLIYSEGRCYIKSYTRKDYDSLIGQRKLEWKRQDKLDYKIQWEKLDWFWNALAKYKKNDSKKEDLIEAFDAMDISDRIWCYQNTKWKSCVDIKNEFAENINQFYFNIIDDLNRDITTRNICLKLRHVSPKIYIINIKWEYNYLDYEIYDVQEERIRLKNNLFVFNIDQIKYILKSFINECNKNIELINNIIDMSSLPFVKKISPKSHYWTSVTPVSELCFNVIFEDNIHNQYIKEEIGNKSYNIFNITKRRLKKDYKELRQVALDNLDKEIKLFILDSNKELLNFINFNEVKNRVRRIYRSYNKIYYAYGSANVEYSLLELKDNTHIDQMVHQVKRRYFMCLRREEIIKSIMSKYIDIVNSCKNKLWKIKRTTNPYIYTIIFDNLYIRDINLKQPFSNNSIKAQICSIMNEMAHGLYEDVRLLEVDTRIE